MDCIVHGVAKSQTHMSECHFHFLGYRGPRGISALTDSGICWGSWSQSPKNMKEQPGGMEKRYSASLGEYGSKPQWDTHHIR